MQRTIIAAAIALALQFPLAHADDATSLAPVVVSVSRNAATLAEMPQSTTIVTHEDIEKSPAQSLDQLLRNVAGLNLGSVPATSKDPTGQSLSMRGLGNVTVLVLLDGVPIMDPFYGTVQWFKAPLSSIDHIEIVRGGSVVWGNMAVGGVINIVTKRPSGNEGTVSATYGSFGSTDLALSKGFKVNDALSFNLSLDQTKSNGYQLTPAPYAWRYPAKAPITTRDSTAELTAYLHPSADLDGYLRLGYHINDEEISYQYGDNRQTSPDLAASLTRKLGGHDALTANVWAQEVTFDKSNGATCYWQATGTHCPSSSSVTPAQVNNNIEQYYTQYGVQGYHEIGTSLLYSKTIGQVWRDFQLGMDYRRLSAADNESIYGTPTVDGATTGVLAASVVGSGAQSYSGLFAQTRINPIRPLLITLAAREDRFSSSIDSTEGMHPTLSGDVTKTKFDPSVSARYELNEDISLRASVNQTFRGPGLNNTLRSYGSASSTPSIANPFLVPQDMLEREFGFDYAHGSLNLSATYFLYSITNVILSTKSVASGAPSVYQQQLCGYFGASSCNFYSNAGDERSQGIELIAGYTASPSLRFDGSFTLTDAVLTSTTTTTPINVQLAGIPRLMGSLGVTWTPVGNVELYAQAHYFGSMNYDTSSSGGPYAQGPSTVFDVSARYHLNRKVDLTLAVNNVFNRTYTDSTWTYGQPYGQTLDAPRMAYAGVQVKF